MEAKLKRDYEQLGVIRHEAFARYEQMANEYIRAGKRVPAHVANESKMIDKAYLVAWKRWQDYKVQNPPTYDGMKKLEQKLRADLKQLEKIRDKAYGDLAKMKKDYRRRGIAFPKHMENEAKIIGKAYLAAVMRHSDAKTKFARVKRKNMEEFNAKMAALPPRVRVVRSHGGAKRRPSAAKSAVAKAKAMAAKLRRTSAARTAAATRKKKPAGLRKPKAKAKKRLRDANGRFVKAPGIRSML